MNKKTIIIVVSIILVIIAGLVFVSVRPKKDSTVTTTTPQPATKAPDDGQYTTMPVVEKGKYVSYVDDASTKVAGTKLLFFHASWCPQCRALDESIKSSTLPDDTVILKVDYDSNQALRQKYGVTIQTTVVKINDDGEKVASYVAYEEPNFAAVQKALLP